MLFALFGATLGWAGLVVGDVADTAGRGSLNRAVDIIAPSEEARITAAGQRLCVSRTRLSASVWCH
jgi:hypothetical protein